MDNKKFYIGIDLGGTFIKGAIVDDMGEIVVENSLPTQAKEGEEIVFDNIVTVINNLLKDANMSENDVEGIGMGVPGMIDSKKGIVICSGNFNWENVNIVDGIKKRTSLPLTIDNDANAAALGESKFGNGKDIDDMILITLGTGVGGGIVVNHKLVEGNRSAGGEPGHMVIKAGGEQCACGRKGCFEAYASATALIRDTKRAMQNHFDSLMWEIGGVENVTGKTAFDYAEKDKYAKEVIDNYIEMLGLGIANLVNILRPNAVMIGGGISAQGDNLLKPLQKVVNRELFAGELGPQCPVIVASLKNKAGVLGAAALIMDN